MKVHRQSGRLTNICHQQKLLISGLTALMLSVVLMLGTATTAHAQDTNAFTNSNNFPRSNSVPQQNPNTPQSISVPQKSMSVPPNWAQPLLDPHQQSGPSASGLTPTREQSPQLTPTPLHGSQTQDLQTIKSTDYKGLAPTGSEIPVPETITKLNPMDDVIGLEAPLKRQALGTQSPLSARGDKSQGTGSVATMIPATALCLVALIVFWIACSSFRKKMPQFAPTLPNEALEFLGRKSIDQRSTIFYIRCGNRILIVGQSEGGMRTLGEMTDPLEIDLVAGLCRAEKHRDSPITESFRTLFTRTQPAAEPSTITPDLIKERLSHFASLTSNPAKAPARKVRET
jgi:flagellar biogenesis protein FliO